MRKGLYLYFQLLVTNCMRKKVSAMYAEDCEPEDVLSVLACTQRLIDSNERVLNNLDDERKDYKAAID